MKRLSVLLLFLSTMIACSSTYYAVWEKLGYEKRDLLHGAIEDAREDQIETVKEFRDALEALRANYDIKASELQDFYDHVRDEYEDSQYQSETLRARIGKMDRLARDLFDEWKTEALAIQTTSLRTRSLRQREQTLERYTHLHRTLERSSRSMDPVLTQMRDYVYYLKHNLNARAIGALKGEARNITVGMEKLTDKMSASIQEIDSFLRHLEGA